MCSVCMYSVDNPNLYYTSILSALSRSPVFMWCIGTRCTLGEVSSALEDSWGRHLPSTAVVRGAYSASYNEPAEVILHDISRIAHFPPFRSTVLSVAMKA